MLDIIPTSRFKKDFKRLSAQNKDLERLQRVIDLLRLEKALPESCQDHKLLGNFAGWRECHITSDWLLIYRIDRGALVLILERTGDHAKLYGK